jgi:uncharacterized protein YbjT (DUF2867 family)
VGRTVYISGGTGYIGNSLIPRLSKRGHFVRALCRKGSEHKLHRYADPSIGDALDPTTFSPAGFDTFVHLVGTPHPAPWKGEQFRSVDLVSLKASVAAAKLADISHFVYVSVAQPAPLMKAYVEVRAECEAIIRDAGLCATLIRPWYVLGRGHWWPFALKPAYWMLETLPTTAAAARRLGLITLDQMVEAMAWAIEHPPEAVRIIDVEGIRRINSQGHAGSEALCHL